MADNILDRINSAASDVQNAANVLAERIRQGGDVAVRVSNAATGAAAGARAGAAVPLTLSPTVKYGGAALLAYLLLRRR